MWLKCSLLKVVRDAKNGGKMGKMGGGEKWARIPNTLLLMFDLATVTTQSTQLTMIEKIYIVEFLFRLCHSRWFIFFNLKIA